MTNLSAATAAPVQHVLSSGKTITLHPLALADIGELEAWIRSELFKVTSEQLRTNAIPDNARDDLMQNTILACGRVSMFSKSAQGITGSLGGIARMVSLSMRHSDPTATPEQVYTMLDGIEVLTDVSEKVLEVSGFTGTPETADGAPKKVKAGTSQGESGAS